MITVSLPNSKDKSARDLIFYILTEESGLSAKQIHNRMKKRKSSLSYQAMFLGINQLLDAGIIEKNYLSYSLSKEWIIETKQFLENLEKSLDKTNPTLIVNDKTTHLSFDQVFELGKFIRDALSSEFIKMEGDVYCHVSHLWFFIISNKTLEIIKSKTKGANFHIACSGKTDVDKMLVKSYEELGFKVKLGVKTPSAETFVIGDKVFNLYSAEIMKKLEEFYSQKNNLSKFNFIKFYTKLYSKTNIELTINNNKNIARMERNRIKKLF